MESFGPISSTAEGASYERCAIVDQEELGMFPAAIQTPLSREDWRDEGPAGHQRIGWMDQGSAEGCVWENGPTTCSSVPVWSDT
jgi:hypothetical protein